MSTLDFQRYDSGILVQHIDNSENIMVTFVESRIKAYLNHIRLL